MKKNKIFKTKNKNFDSLEDISDLKILRKKKANKPRREKIN